MKGGEDHVPPDEQLEDMRRLMVRELHNSRGQVHTLNISWTRCE